MTRPHPSGDRQSPSPSLRAGSPRVSPGAFFFRHAALCDSDKAQGCGHQSESVHVRLRSLLIAAGDVMQVKSHPNRTEHAARPNEGTWERAEM